MDQAEARTPSKPPEPASETVELRIATAESAPPEEVEILPPPPLAKRIALLLGFLVLGVLGFFTAGRLSTALETREALEVERRASAEAAGQAIEVPVVSPQPAQSAPLVVLTGTLEPVQAADLAFGVPGQVASVSVSLGETVEEGDVLVTLDRASVGAQSAQSAAAIQVAEANAEMARDRVELMTGLVERGSMAERELTTARQQLAITEAQLQQARAGRQQVAASSANHILRAPFDGVITRVPSGVGVAANPGVTLVRVEDLSSLRLRTTVNRQDLEVLEVGMTASIDGTGASGELAAVVRSLDQQTRRAPVEVNIPNPEGNLVANALVRARVAVGTARSVLRIPAPSRRPDGSVFVIGADSRIEPRMVTAEADEDGSWLVSDGVTLEDRIVLRPALVREGVVVRPVDPEASPQTAAVVEAP